jgi:hypothetical protein
MDEHDRERLAAEERQEIYEFRLMLAISVLIGIIAGLLIKRWLNI